MATLTVWKFDTVSGAERALALLERMQKEELIQINDAAYVYWPEGKKKPKTRAAAPAWPAPEPWAAASGACCSA